jgi:hypothetical protein
MSIFFNTTIMRFHNLPFYMQLRLFQNLITVGFVCLISFFTTVLMRLKCVACWSSVQQLTCMKCRILQCCNTNTFFSSIFFVQLVISCNPQSLNPFSRPHTWTLCLENTRQSAKLANRTSSNVWRPHIWQWLCWGRCFCMYGVTGVLVKA